MADKLRQRIPRFFDFMSVRKQIKWGDRLWMARAWGSKSNPDSGLYSYLCNTYDIPFYSGAFTRPETAANSVSQLVILLPH